METIKVYPRRQGEIPTIKIQPKLRQTVAARPIDTLWEKHGWVKKETPRGAVYTGSYRVWEQRSGTQYLYPGRVETGSGVTKAWIQRPPDALLQEHPKRACFNSSGRDGWYWMNWWHGTSDIDTTIGYVIKVLDEAVNRSWQG